MISSFDYFEYLYIIGIITDNVSLNTVYLHKPGMVQSLSTVKPSFRVFIKQLLYKSF